MADFKHMHGPKEIVDDALLKTPGQQPAPSMQLSQSKQDARSPNQPPQVTPHNVLHLQRAIGNQAVVKLLDAVDANTPSGKNPQSSVEQPLTPAPNTLAHDSEQEVQPVAESAPATLDTIAEAVVQRTAGPVVQRATADTRGGKFESKGFDQIGQSAEVGGTGWGAKMALRFYPHGNYKLNPLGLGPSGKQNVNLHLVQTVKEVRYGAEEMADVGGNIREGNLGFGARSVPDGPHQGWGIDVDWKAKKDDAFIKIATSRVDDLQAKITTLDGELLDMLPGEEKEAKQAERDTLARQQSIDQEVLGGVGINTEGLGRLTSLDPRYTQQRLSPKIPVYTTFSERLTSGNSISHDGAKWSSSFAYLRDAPNAVGPESGIKGMDFETAALMEWNGGAAYLGSVKWGWEGKVQAGKKSTDFKDITKLSDTASSAFRAAAMHWNDLTVEDPQTQEEHHTMPLPLEGLEED